MDGREGEETKRGEGGRREGVGVRERKQRWGGDGQRAGEKSGVVMVWRAKSKPANHEAESAHVTGEGDAAENVMKFSEICIPSPVRRLGRRRRG